MKIAPALLLSAPAVSAFAPGGGAAAAYSRGGIASRCADAPTCPSMAAVSVSEGTEREIGAMNDWADVCGVKKSTGFQLTTEDGLDWSVMTTENLAEGAPVLHIPDKMIMSSAKAKAELQELGNVDEAVSYLGRLGANDQVPQFYLFLKVLVEYEKAEASPWYPWLNALPRLFYNAVSMTDFCYECLPPLVMRLARAERVKVDNFIDAMQKVDFLSAETKEDRDLAKWAFNVVSTRCLGPDGGNKQLVPVVDMFNHGTDTEITISPDEAGNVNVFASKDVPAGSPLRMSYGCPTQPSEFFARYGFLDESSPATFCKIMLTPTAQLKDMGYDYSRMLFYKDTGDVSEEVWDVMLYQNLASNRDEQQAFYQAHMAGDADTKRAMHQRYFMETSAALKDHVDTFLTQLDELSAKGIGKDIKDHPRLPLILSHNEFVKSTFLKVQEKLDAMVARAKEAAAM